MLSQLGTQVKSQMRVEASNYLQGLLNLVIFIYVMIKLKFLLEQNSVKLKSDTASLQRWLNAQSNYKGDPLDVY